MADQNQFVNPDGSPMQQAQPLNLMEWGRNVGGGVVDFATELPKAMAGLVPRRVPINGPDGKPFVDPTGQPMTQWDAPTVHGLASLVTSLGNHMGVGAVQDTDVVNQILNTYNQRYGGLDALKHTLATDPGSVVKDIGDAAMLVAGGAGGASKLADAVGFSGAANTLGKVSEATMIPALNRAVGQKLVDAATSLSNKWEQWGPGKANVADTAAWHPGVMKAAEALPGGANNPAFKNVLARTLPGLRDQAPIPRLHEADPLSSNMPRPNTGPVGDLAWLNKGGLPTFNAPDDLRLTDVQLANQNRIKQISDLEQQYFIDPLTKSGKTVNAKPITDAIDNASSEYSRLANPDQVAATANRTRNLYMRPVQVKGPNGPITQWVPKDLTVGQLIQYKAGVNNALDSFMEANPGVQRSSLSNNPATAGLVAEAKAIRDQLYGLDPSGQWRDMELTKGAHIELGDYINSQKNASLGLDTSVSPSQVAGYFARGGLQGLMHEFRGASSNIGVGAVKAVIPVKGAGGKLSDAIKLTKTPAPTWHDPGLSGAPQTPPPMATPWNWNTGSGGGGVPPPPFGNAYPMPPGPGTDMVPMAHAAPYIEPPGPALGSRSQLGPAIPKQLGGPTPGLPPGRIPPQKQLGPSSAAPSGPPIPMAGTKGGLPMPPATDTSGPIPGRQGPAQPIIDPTTGEVIGYSSSQAATPSAPWQGLPPTDGIPPAARGRTIMGIPKPPAAPKPPKGPSATERKLRTVQQFKGAKERLDRQFGGMAKANKTASYGVPAGVLTDPQQGQYNNAINDLNRQQQLALAAIPPDPQGLVGPDDTANTLGIPVPAAAGADLQGPSQVVVGEAGPEKLVHSDGRPPEQVGMNGPQVLTLGTSGSDQVVPEEAFPDKGIIRGSANIPLSEEGQQNAQALGAAFKKAGGLDKIYSSDLARTQQTAQAISQHTGAPIAPPMQGLRSWSLGDLEGTPSTKETDELIQHHINAQPNTPLPGQGPVSVAPGESFNSFKSRVLPTIQSLQQAWMQQPTSRIGVVTHNRDEKLIRGWLEAGGGADIDKRVMEEKGGDPGSVMHMFPIGNQWHMQEFDPAKQKTAPGIYLIRHEKTSWNAQGDKGGGS
jgi:broad specificity phosphatase PhoE